MKNIRLLEQKIDQRIVHLQDALAKNIRASGNRLEFTDWIRFFLLDTITHTIFGEPAGFVHARGDIQGMLAGLRDMTYIALLLGSFPWLIRPLLKIPMLRRQLIPQSGDDWGSGKMFNVSTKRVTGLAFTLIQFCQRLLAVEGSSASAKDPSSLLPR